MPGLGDGDAQLRHLDHAWASTGHAGRGHERDGKAAESQGRSPEPEKTHETRGSEMEMQAGSEHDAGRVPRNAAADGRIVEGRTGEFNLHGKGRAGGSIAGRVPIMYSASQNGWKFMGRPKGINLPARVSVSLDAATYADLCAISRRHDVSAAWVLRRALAEFIERYRNERQAELPLARRVTTRAGGQ